MTKRRWRMEGYSTGDGDTHGARGPLIATPAQASPPAAERVPSKACLPRPRRALVLGTGAMLSGSSQNEAGGGPPEEACPFDIVVLFFVNGGAQCFDRGVRVGRGGRRVASAGRESTSARSKQASVGRRRRRRSPLQTVPSQHAEPRR
ncbi:hypothetical protein MRX96_003808 [Rhipicephalus microplus]